MGRECKLYNGGPIVHLENATRPKGEVHERDRARFLRRWGSYIEAAYL
jgi:hypothetical protein